MQAAQAAVDESGTEADTLAITVLTSMNEETLAQTGVSRGVGEQVRALAACAQEAGLSGVVASPQEAAMLRELLGPDALIVTPGVRPVGAALGDQSRVITQADDPAAAFDAIAADL